MIFSFDVTCSTFDLLKQGITEAHYNSTNQHHRIVIEAATIEEAHLTASQWVCQYSICTGVYLRI